MATKAVNPPPRIAALDFTKGALVVIMVLYHWLNYFVSPQGDFYKYLRFLTPSFICISGFLISHTYLSKYAITDARLPKRLITRGLKILGVFFLLNLVIGLVLTGPAHRELFFLHMGLRNAFLTYVVGNVYVAGVGRGVAFYILVPIAYLLVLCAGLLVVCRWFKYTFYATFVLFLLAILSLQRNGQSSGNLELLTIGLLGVILGYIPGAKIQQLTRFALPLAAAYLGYLVAITLWNEIFPLQIVGVCLSLAVIYLLGSKAGEPGGIRRTILLLGKYSLFAYIGQVIILQLLRRGLPYNELPIAARGVFFLAGLGLTVLCVWLVDQTRPRVPVADRLYKAVFA